MKNFMIKTIVLAVFALMSAQVFAADAPTLTSCALSVRYERNGGGCEDNGVPGDFSFLMSVQLDPAVSYSLQLATINSKGVTNVPYQTGELNLNPDGTASISTGWPSNSFGNIHFVMKVIENISQKVVCIQINDTDAHF